MAENVFIVNAYLLLHEQTRKMLWDYVTNEKGLSELNPSIYHIIDYSSEDGTIRLSLLDCAPESLGEKFDSGYIAMNFLVLQQLSSLRNTNTKEL